MNSVLEDDKKLMENSIKYLHNVCRLPELDVPTLKSIYSTKRRLMELRKNMFLPSNLTRTSVACQRCLINVNDGPASYSIKPERKRSKFAKKLVAKDNSGKPLTKYQREYLKRMSNFSGNQLTITCKFCKKESSIKLNKPKIIHKPVTHLNSSQQKKKKRDKFFGLDQQVVLSLTPQNMRNLDNLSDSVKDSTPKLKIRKKEIEKRKTPIIQKPSPIENKHQMKKKHKKLSRLSDFLNNSIGKANKSPGLSLKEFLRSW